jgi:hypothetical protein
MVGGGGEEDDTSEMVKCVYHLRGRIRQQLEQMEPPPPVQPLRVTPSPTAVVSPPFSKGTEVSFHHLEPNYVTRMVGESDFIAILVCLREAMKQPNKFFFSQCSFSFCDKFALIERG